jgi:hypothetical protein
MFQVVNRLVDTPANLPWLTADSPSFARSAANLVAPNRRFVPAAFYSV